MASVFFVSILVEGTVQRPELTEARIEIPGPHLLGYDKRLLDKIIRADGFEKTEQTELLIEISNARF
ncbi:MAG: hypothetical protein AAFN77_15850 [Planctomycetota bacterium]